MVTVIHGSIRIKVEDSTEGGTRMMAIAAVETKISTGIVIMIKIEKGCIDIDHGHVLVLAQWTDLLLVPVQRASVQLVLTWHHLVGQCSLMLPFKGEPMERLVGHSSPSTDTVDIWLTYRYFPTIRNDGICFFIISWYILGQLSGIPQTMPGVVQNSLPFGALHMALPLMPAQALTQQATRHARRVYVGGLPPLANEQTIATFFSQVMAAIGRNSVGSISELAGDAVVNVYINHEKKFAFVEMRTFEEASNAMALDGIIFEGVAVRVRRPTDYNPTLAATLGPSQPSPHLNLAAIGLTQGAIGGVEGPDRIFVGGLPYYFTEAQIRELLQSFGPLRGFDLMKDNDTGNSKGYGFCVYQDPTVTDVACGALNGLKMGDKTLTVQRASASNRQSKTEQENILVQAQQHIAMQKMAMRVVDLNLLGAGMATMASGETPTKVLCLTEAITADQLGDDEEYVEILEDMRDECSKFGTLVNVVIPRADQGGEQIPGVGKVFLEYTDIGGCANAKNVLGGRKFGGNTVNAVYYPEEKYYIRDYSA